MGPSVSLLTRVISGPDSPADSCWACYCLSTRPGLNGPKLTAHEYLSFPCLLSPPNENSRFCPVWWQKSCLCPLFGVGGIYIRAGYAMLPHFIHPSLVPVPSVRDQHSITLTRLLGSQLLPEKSVLVHAEVGVSFLLNQLDDLSGQIFWPFDLLLNPILILS